MFEILARAGCFVAIIVLGYTLRRVGFFKKEDFHLLSKIVIKVTLTAAIVTNFAGQRIEVSLLSLCVLAIGYGALQMLAAAVINARRSADQRAFAMLNTAGCNIGNFALPFAQGFLGPAGVLAVSLFDAGNGFICLGGAYGVADMVRRRGGHFSVKPILKALLTSPPFIAYVVMTALSLAHLSLPGPVVEFAGIISNANAFMAMLMIGVGFELHADKSQLGALVRILGQRYLLAFAFAALCWFVLPYPIAYRQALVLLAFSPIASAAPAFTARMGGDFGLSSAINSLSILISIVLITGALIVML